MIENLIFQEHAENLCYCKQREDRGVKDVFQIEFMIKSKLYISDMSYTMSEFGRQKSMLEKSVDEMILRNLNESVVKPAGFVRSQVMQVRAANDPSVVTITEKAPTRAFSWLEAPTSTFTFKTLLRHYAKQALRHGK